MGCGSSRDFEDTMERARHARQHRARQLHEEQSPVPAYDSEPEQDLAPQVKPWASSGAISIDGFRIARQFCPSMCAAFGYRLEVDPDQRPDLLSHNVFNGYWQLRAVGLTDPWEGDSKVLGDTMVLSIAVAEKRSSRRDEAQWAYGIAFGPNSRFNEYGLLSDDLPQGAMMAVLQGLIRALEQVADVVENDNNGNKISTVRIMTDSRKLLEVLAWHRRPCDVFLDVIAAEVAPYFRKAEKYWSQLEAQSEIQIQLWLVAAKEVAVAFGCAEKALYAKPVEFEVDDAGRPLDYSRRTRR